MKTVPARHNIGAGKEKRSYSVVMEHLLKSADPLLTLAGALFALGLAFDVIFSATFKEQIKQTITRSYLRNAKFSRLVVDYSKYFVRDILSLRRPSQFVLKTVSLSVLFYLIVALIEARSSIADQSIQSRVFESVALFAPSILILFFFHAVFDIFSSLVSVLYFNMIAAHRRSYEIAVILVSDFIVSAFLWGLFFSYAMATHLKVADFTQRQVNLALNIDRQADSGWGPDSFFQKNATLHGKVALVASLAEYDEEDQSFYGLESNRNASIVAVTNITDDKLIAQKFLQELKNSNAGVIIVSPKIDLIQERYSSRVTISRVIGRDEFGKVLSSSARLLSPLVLSFDQFGRSYFAVRRLYAWFLSDFRDHLDFSNILLFCDETAYQMSTAEVNVFDFSACTTYFITSRDTGRYMALWAGYFFSTNYVFSHGAFFWSSMALMASFYILLFALVLIKLARHLLSWNVINQVLNIERGFFACLFAVPSALVLLIFIVKVLLRTIGN